MKAASSAGKTTLMDAVLSFFPEEEKLKYSAMTGQSLYYLGTTSLRHKILAIVEEAGAKKATYALKLLQSERELTIASTGKDPNTGRLVAQEYRVEGPVVIFLATTAINLDEELQNRCLILSVDDSSTQTTLIHSHQREKRTLAGMIAREVQREILALLCNVQRLLSPIEVINPFAPSLTFQNGRTRNRRDHEKYLTLIDSIALLHQHQRPHHEQTIGDRRIEYIEVTLEDIALANQLASEVLSRSLDELPPQTRLLLELLHKLAASKQESTKKPSIFTRKEARDATGWSLSQISVHLRRLVDYEYLALRYGHMGHPFLYELLGSGQTPRSTAQLGLIDVEQLRKAHAYATEVTGLEPRVSGGDKEEAVTPNPFEKNILSRGSRTQAATMRETISYAIVS
jgi:hypothetical protein